MMRKRSDLKPDDDEEQNPRNSQNGDPNTPTEENKGGRQAFKNSKDKTRIHCGERALSLLCTKVENTDGNSPVKPKLRCASPHKHAVPDVSFIVLNRPNHVDQPQATTNPSSSTSLSPSSSHSSNRFGDSINNSTEPPEFFKNNLLPCDTAKFLNGSKSNLFEWDDVPIILMDGSLSSINAKERSGSAAVFVDVHQEEGRWRRGSWGIVPVQLKKLHTMNEESPLHNNTEITILRKCRHPNIILLMAIYLDISEVGIICEESKYSLFSLLHCQYRVLSGQESVRFALDVANALEFLRMRGFIHSELSSKCIMITAQDTVKLADLGPCLQLSHGTHENSSQDARGSHTSNEDDYLKNHAVAKSYESVEVSEAVQWLAPEMFVPDDNGQVYPCSKSDVYSLCLILWESCNGSVPQRDRLDPLPADGSYPGALLAALQAGARADRRARPDVSDYRRTLAALHDDMEKMDPFFIPLRLRSVQTLSADQSFNSGVALDDYKSTRDTSTEHINTDATTLSESSQRLHSTPTFTGGDKINENPRDLDLVPEKIYSFSTQGLKLRFELKNKSPAIRARSNSENNSILSHSKSNGLEPLDEYSEDQRSSEGSITRLSKSFAPKAYKSPQIEVAQSSDVEKETVPRDDSDSGQATCKYSTSIARNNMLRKQAWLSKQTTEGHSTIKDSVNGPTAPVGESDGPAKRSM